MYFTSRLKKGTSVASGERNPEMYDIARAEWDQQRRADIGAIPQNGTSLRVERISG